MFQGHPCSQPRSPRLHTNQPFNLLSDSANQSYNLQLKPKRIAYINQVTTGLPSPDVVFIEEFLFGFLAGELEPEQYEAQSRQGRFYHSKCIR